MTAYARSKHRRHNRRKRSTLTNAQLVARVLQAPRDPSPGAIAASEELATLADWFTRTYAGPETWLRELQRMAVHDGVTLTDRQRASALRVMRREAAQP